MALYSSCRINGQPIASSEAIFVHNNSKHGRRTLPYGREAAVVGDGKQITTNIAHRERDMTQHRDRVTIAFKLSSDVVVFCYVTGKPYIIAVHPSEGWATGGTKVCIVGMNFYEGVEVVFGTLPASSEVHMLVVYDIQNIDFECLNRPAGYVLCSLRDLCHYSQIMALPLNVVMAC